ncbi:MAG TPA: EVE domain-containing protein [Candidatus Dormibacteraeota bacterium]
MSEEEVEHAEARPAGSGKRRRRKGGGGGGQRPSSYWMIVTSPENFRKSRELSFSVQGVKRRHRRRMESIKAGDRLLYYVTGRMVFAATATVTSPMFEDHTPIWRSTRREEDYPWRVHIRPERVLDEQEWIAARDVAFRLEYVRKWPPEHWTLAFQGNLHQLPRTDFQLIEGELERQQRRSGAA